jgi:hypothetical protein
VNTPEGRIFNEELRDSAPIARPTRTMTLLVGTAPPCQCGCGRPATVRVMCDGPVHFATWTELEVLVAALRHQAEKLWGPHE